LERFARRVSALEGLEKRRVYALVALLFVLASLEKSWVISSSDGGGDVVCDLEKTMMVLRGSNPYGVSAWSAPYPPFYFVVLAGILSVGTGFRVAGSTEPGLILTLRLAALVFDLATGLVIYLTVLKTARRRAYALLSMGLYLLAPGVSASETLYEGWFHGDTFGYLLVALAILLFTSKRYSLGSLFLGLAVAFKVHPVLALPLAAVWFHRRRIGFARNTAILGATALLGLALPAALVPHCYEVLVGFNASTVPAHSVTLFNLLYHVLPTFWGMSTPLPVINLIWSVSTAALLALAGLVVWRRHEGLELVDIVVIGTVVWLLPLRQVHVRYLLWFIVPFLMRGKPLENILVVSIQEAAALLSGLAWFCFVRVGNYPSPGGVLAFFGIGVLCALNEILALRLTMIRGPARRRKEGEERAV